MRIILNGAAGQMGRKITALVQEREDIEIVASVSPEFDETNEGEYSDIRHFTGIADCVVDFSNHVATTDVTEYCVKHKLPIVIATTGQSDDEKKIIEESSKSVPVFFSANMSIGVAVTCELARKAVMAFPDADVEIVEAHHNRKVDVPSGTAIMIADSIKEAKPNAEFVIGRHKNGRRQKQEIGIHSLRLGNVVGMHEVIINTGTETLTIKHEAADRALFADGAMVAAAFIVDKAAGLYNMKDIMR